jgi:hypothetical protein
MKQLIFPLLIGLLVGCGGSDSGGNSDEVRFTFGLDTVMVNPGEEILFLNSGLSQAQLSKDKKYLYNFNHTDFSIEKINLDELKFEDKITLSREGPNGVGQFFMGFVLLDENSMLFRCFNQDNIVDWNGNKKHQFDFKKVGNERERISDKEHLFMPTVHPEQPQIYFGLVANWEEKSTTMVVLDLANDEIKRIDLPLFEKTKGFEIEFNDGQMGFGIGTEKYINRVGGKLFVSAEISSEVFVYNQLTGEMEHRTFESELTANEKKGKHPNKFSDRKELEGIYKKIHEEIGFHAFHWDEKSDVYYRFSSQAIFSDIGELRENQVVPSPIGAKVYLTVYDKDLNQIAESRVPMLTKKPAFHFVKDGKIWLFENIGDEMGFVRLSILNL